jgi:hypothetical protein
VLVNRDRRQAPRFTDRGQGPAQASPPVANRV